jgi:hypothetical protein
MPFIPRFKSLGFSGIFYKRKRKAMMISDRPSPERAAEKRTTPLVFITGWPIIPASF